MYYYTRNDWVSSSNSYWKSFHKCWNQSIIIIYIKFDMVGTYLGEYALSYNPTRHGRPGLGASKGSAKWNK